MILRFETPLALTMLGLLTTACVVPETNDTNDDLGTETEDTESDGSTDDAESDSSSSSSDDAESSSSSSSSDDVDTVDTLDTESDTDGDQCECIAEQPDDEAPMMPICGEMLCDEVNAADDPDAEFGGKLVTTPEALECALTALRDRTPGIVTWSSSFMGSQYSETGYVLIYETGEAVRREWGANDLSYDVDPALRFDLPDAAHYEDCLANPIDTERYSCLRAYAPQNPPPFVCEAGWSESDT